LAPDTDTAKEAPMIHTEEAMLDVGPARKRAGASGAGIAAIAFSVSTIAALVLANAPGGNYNPSQVADYLAKGHRVIVLVAFALGFIGVLCLISVVAHFREVIAVAGGNRRAADIFWAAGVAAAASFGIGWCVVGGQVVAHLEGGTGIVVGPALTYLISEIGVVFIFGGGAILLGFALIVLMANSRALLPTWLRRFTLIAGIAGIAGLAFFTFFILMLWGLVTGAWLCVADRRLSPSPVRGAA
jgi:hypothetical protein